MQPAVCSPIAWNLSIILLLYLINNGIILAVRYPVCLLYVAHIAMSDNVTVTNKYHVEVCANKHREEITPFMIFNQDWLSPVCCV